MKWRKRETIKEKSNEIKKEKGEKGDIRQNRKKERKKERKKIHEWNK